MKPKNVSRASFADMLNFNPSMDKKSHVYNVWDVMNFTFPNINGCTVEVWEYISKLIPRIVLDAITYSCRD